MFNSSRGSKVLTTLAIAVALAACAKTEDSPVAATPSPIKLTAGIQDIMKDLIEPAAEFLWESVSTTTTAAGEEEKQPRTDEEWAEVRKQALIIAESANLILLPGRHVAREGQVLDDHGTPGNLTAAQAEQAIAADRATYEAFGQALHDAGVAFLKGAEERNPQALLDAGAALDEACEGCHLKFWYPGQVIPALPQQAPEVN